MKYLFHPTDGARLFADDANPEGWFDTPAAFGVITCPSLEQLAEMAARMHPTPDAASGMAAALAESLAPMVSAELAGMSKDELLALAEQRGVDVDKRWGLDRLKAALNGDSP